MSGKKKGEGFDPGFEALLGETFNKASRSARIPKSKMNAQPTKKEDKKEEEQEALEKLEEEYQHSMDAGKEELKAANFVKALEYFNNAKTLKPKELLPEKNIEEVKRLEREKKESERKAQEENTESSYKEAIKEADNMFQQRDLKNSIEAYEKALTIKPGDSYAVAKLQEIDKLECEYLDAMDAGQRELDAKNFDNAIEHFNNAKTLKPKEILPERKIEEVEELRNVNNTGEDKKTGEVDKNVKNSIKLENLLFEYDGDYYAQIYTRSNDRDFVRLIARFEKVNLNILTDNIIQAWLNVNSKYFEKKGYLSFLEIKDIFSVENPSGENLFSKRKLAKEKDTTMRVSYESAESMRNITTMEYVSTKKQFYECVSWFKKEYAPILRKRKYYMFIKEFMKDVD